METAVSRVLVAQIKKSRQPDFFNVTQTNLDGEIFDLGRYNMRNNCRQFYVSPVYYVQKIYPVRCPLVYGLCGLFLCLCWCLVLVLAFTQSFDDFG